MDKCTCDGNEKQYYSMEDWECKEKQVGRKYGHNDKIHKTNCIDICEAV